MKSWFCAFLLLNADAGYGGKKNDLTVKEICIHFGLVPDCLRHILNNLNELEFAIFQEIPAKYARNF